MLQVAKPISKPSRLASSFQSQVSQCSCSAHLNALCLRFALRLGIQAVAYHHLPPFGAQDKVAFNLICVGFPAELVAAFENNNPIELDASSKHVLRGTRALWWDKTHTPGRQTKEQKEWLEYAQSKLGFGVHLPVFGPGRRDGYISLSLGDTRPDWSEHELSMLQLCCQYAHQRYCHFVLESLPRHAKLSPREEEILSWAAMGKSNGAIADILEITESSVITYLERAFQKLGVDSRVTATLRASSLGELNWLP